MQEHFKKTNIQVDVTGLDFKNPRHRKLIIKARESERAHRTMGESLPGLRRLKQSGLWDYSAAARSKITVTKATPEQAAEMKRANDAYHNKTILAIEQARKMEEFLRVTGHGSPQAKSSATWDQVGRLRRLRDSSVRRKL